MFVIRIFQIDTLYTGTVCWLVLWHWVSWEVW